MLESMFSKLLAWPSIYENSQMRGLLLIPETKVSKSNEEGCSLDAAEGYYHRGKREDESEKSVIYEVGSKSSHDNIETDLKKGQQGWSCDVCLISTTSKKCLEKHLKGKKLKAQEEENRRNKAVESKRVSFPSKLKEVDRMTSLGNLNGNKWVNLDNLSSLFSPIARSIGWSTWKSPESGWTKLNTDGSVDRENARFGGLLRDIEVIQYAVTSPNLLKMTFSWLSYGLYGGALFLHWG
ncbi:hypothetical protein RHGRI_016525 [Rhododendron griersonianum]|nr:hypothetical protein RHGRI_016525 [Rhododendron griersonianum]